jgi:ubiquinone/menaquinone biosynthesis C-methylase UbiE
MFGKPGRRERRFKRKAYAQFSAWAETYDRHWLNRFLFEPSHALLLKELDSLAPGRILDVGCGTGEFAARLAARGWEVLALDLCEPMVRQAYLKAVGIGGGVRVAVGDSEHLPFAPRSFDVVTCANSFHHYPHHAKVVRDMFRILRPGGRLLLLDGWPDQFMGRIIYDLIITRVEGGSVWHRESHHVRAMFEKAGFRRIKQTRTYSVFPILLTQGLVPAEEARPAG